MNLKEFEQFINLEENLVKNMTKEEVFKLFKNIEEILDKMINIENKIAHNTGDIAGINFSLIFLHTYYEILSKKYQFKLKYDNVGPFFFKYQFKKILEESTL